MSNIDKRAQKELYAKVERQAHALRGNPIAYQVVTGMCPVNVIEMQAKKVQALLDELEAKDKRIAELSASHGKLHEGMAAIYNAICENGASTSLSAILTFVKRAFEESKVTTGISVKGE